MKSIQKQNILVLRDLVDIVVYCVSNLFREWFWHQPGFWKLPILKSNAGVFIVCYITGDFWLLMATQWLCSLSEEWEMFSYFMNIGMFQKYFKVILCKQKRVHNLFPTLSVIIFNDMHLKFIMEYTRKKKSIHKLY